MSVVERNVWMLGFLPENSTRQNLTHGEKLIEQCNHGSIKQIHAWWQDPNMYYAFESKKGAEWMAEHGGPQTFMRMVKEHCPAVRPPPMISPFKIEPVCYSCGESMHSVNKKMPLKVFRCMCGTKIVHATCFMPKSCPICGIQATVFHREQTIMQCV